MYCTAMVCIYKMFIAWTLENMCGHAKYVDESVQCTAVHALSTYNACIYIEELNSSMFIVRYLLMFEK